MTEQSPCGQPRGFVSATRLAFLLGRDMNKLEGLLEPEWSSSFVKNWDAKLETKEFRPIFSHVLYPPPHPQ